MPSIIKNATALARAYIAAARPWNGVVVDATAGKGQDTVFLAKLVGPAGRVYAFDIQAAAIHQTAVNLDRHNLKNVRLIRDGHENMDKYLEEPVSAVMFNLGYLPGGDHRLVTRPETTVKAVMTATRLLKPAGLITIVVYTGHPGSIEESELLGEKLSSLDQKQFEVFKGTYPNQINNPPYLFVIEKKPTEAGNEK